MAGEKFLSSLCVVSVLVGMMGGSEGAFQVLPSQENVIHHGLKIVHSTEEPSERYAPSQVDTFYHPPALQYQQLVHEHPQQQQQLSPESQVHPYQHQHHQQFLVQSGYNVGPPQQHGQEEQVHREEPASEQQPHLQQRQTALPYNNQRLHVKIEYAGAGHGIARQHGTHPATQEPKQDYRAAIPKSIAPKLNPLHHSFHQKRNFVPLHHITRQVPVPAGRHGQGHAHSHQQPQQHPVTAALAGSPPKHIAG